jgi:hypothetical protein
MARMFSKDNILVQKNLFRANLKFIFYSHHFSYFPEIAKVFHAKEQDIILLYLAHFYDWEN